MWDDTALYILRLVFTNEDVLLFLATIISSMLMWIAGQAINYFGIRIRADRMALLQAAMDKAMMLAVMRTRETIEREGWDSTDAQFEVINKAVPIIETKFRETLHKNGLWPGDEKSRRMIRDQMERMLPDVFARAAASPATPHAPVAAAVVVPSPAQT